MPNTGDSQSFIYTVLNHFKCVLLLLKILFNNDEDMYFREGMYRPIIGAVRVLDFRYVAPFGI